MLVAAFTTKINVRGGDQGPVTAPAVLASLVQTAARAGGVFCGSRNDLIQPLRARPESGSISVFAFPSATNAVRAGVAMQRLAQPRSGSLPLDSFRVGLATGELTRPSGKLGGPAIENALDACVSAGNGWIVLTRTTREILDQTPLASSCRALPITTSQGIRAESTLWTFEWHDPDITVCVGVGNALARGVEADTEAAQDEAKTQIKPAVPVLVDDPLLLTPSRCTPARYMEVLEALREQRRTKNLLPGDDPLIENFERAANLEFARGRLIDATIAAERALARAQELAIDKTFVDGKIRRLDRLLRAGRVIPHLRDPGEPLAQCLDIIMKHYKENDFAATNCEINRALKLLESLMPGRGQR